MGHDTVHYSGLRLKSFTSDQMAMNV